jgi:hypothetical protein
MCGKCKKNDGAASKTESESAGSENGMSAGTVAAVVIILLAIAAAAVYVVAQSRAKMPCSNQTETIQESSTVVAFTNPAYLATGEVESEKQGAIITNPAEEVDGKPTATVNQMLVAIPTAGLTAPSKSAKTSSTSTDPPASQEREDTKGAFAPTVLPSLKVERAVAPTANSPAAEEESFNGFDLDGLTTAAPAAATEKSPAAEAESFNGIDLDDLTTAAPAAATAKSPAAVAESFNGFDFDDLGKTASTSRTSRWAATKSLSMPAHGGINISSSIVASNTAYLNAAPSVALGDRVTVDGYKSEGTVRFAGPHKSKGTLRVGVELDRQVGKNNGTIGDHVYFIAKERHGILCFPNDCTIVSNTSNADVDNGVVVIEAEMPFVDL